MKINLLLSSTNTLAGYINVDPLAEENDKHGRVSNDVTDLDGIADDGEVEEIIAEEIIEYFPFKDADGILNHWIKKLKRGGVLRVIDLDIYEINKAIETRTLNMDDVNLSLYGHQDVAWRYRKCMFNCKQVADVLRAKGLKILSKKVMNMKFIVEAQRP